MKNVLMTLEEFFQFKSLGLPPVWNFSIQGNLFCVTGPEDLFEAYGY